MTDTELLRQAQCGDVDAWRALYAQCLPSVWRFAVAAVGNRAVAEDVVSETMLAMVKSLPQLDADAVKLHAWLRGVARRKVVDHRRQRSRDQRVQESAQCSTASSSNVAGPTSSLEAVEERVLVLETLGRLPELERTVLEWKHVEGLSVREIARRVKKTEKSIESVLFRARKEFRRLHERACCDTCVNGDLPRREPETLEKSL